MSSNLPSPSVLRLKTEVNVTVCAELVDEAGLTSAILTMLISAARLDSQELKYCEDFGDGCENEFRRICARYIRFLDLLVRPLGDYCCPSMGNSEHDARRRLRVVQRWRAQRTAMFDSQMPSVHEHPAIQILKVSCSRPLVLYSSSLFPLNFSLYEKLHTCEVSCRG